MTVRNFSAYVDFRTFLMSGGLSYTFSRTGVATIDPDGAAVAANAMRFDGLVTVPTVDTVTHVHSSTGAQVLASGLDLDGTAPLMLYVDWERGDLYVFKSGSITPETSTGDLPNPSSGIYNKRDLALRDASSGAQTGGSAAQFYDLFTGTDPGTAFLIRAARIFHGLIVVAGIVYVKVPASDPAEYDIGGFGFAYSQDKGVSWSMHWDDTADPAQFNHLRGAAWVLSANPIYERGSAHPREIWFSCADYLDANQTEPAASGRVYIFKATRETDTGEWAPDVVQYFDLAEPVTHAHSAGITEWSDGETEGLQMVVSAGDNQNRARFIRFILADKDSDYTYPPNWEVLEDYHGAKSSETDPDDDVPEGESSKSMQPVACGFGPNEQELLWGADEQNDWITMMHLPTEDDSGMPPTARQAYFEHHYGWGTGFGSKELTVAGCRHAGLVFFSNQPQPEKATSKPIVAIVGDGATGTDDNLNRIIYAPSLPSEGVSQWAQIGVVRTDYNSDTNYSGLTVALYGPSTASWNTVYYTEYAAGGVRGLKRIAVPTLVSMRPVVVAPGGNNLVIKNDSGTPDIGFFVKKVNNASYADFTEIWRSTTSTAFVDPDTSVTLPLPPGMGLRLLRLETSRSSDARPTDKVQLWVSTTSSAGTPAFESPCLWVTSEQVRRFRAWVLDGTWKASEPNKTTQFSPKTSDRVNSTPIPGPPVLTSGSNHWTPVTIFAHRVVNGTQQGLGLELYPNYGGGDGPDDNRYYLLMDQALDGNGSLGYPQVPTEKGDTFPPNPIDELLKITGLALNGTNHWLLRLTLMMPFGNWDQYADRYDGETSKKIWPLFCLFPSSGPQFIEFLADCENKRFAVNINDGSNETPHSFGGDGKHVWLPESPLHIVIGFNKTDTTEDNPKLLIGASLGGDIVRTLEVTDAGWAASITFNEVRFRGVPRTGYSNGEVCEMRVLGGSADTDASAPTEASIKSAFTSLSYL